MKHNTEKKYSSAGKLMPIVMLIAIVLISCNRTGITDTALPEVIATNPTADAEEVPLDAMIIATFSEEMDTATFNTSSFRLTLNDSLVPGIVSVTPTSATFVPLNNLLAGRTYTVTITTDIADAMGYTMSNSYEWQFSTISGDAEPTIEVTSTNPIDHSTEVDAAVTIIANFSEEMNPVTVNAETFTLRQGTNQVSGTVSLNDDTSATFTPSEDLNPGVTYTATVNTGAESINGNNLAQNYSWSFTTAGNPDDNPPDDDSPSDIIPPEIVNVDPNNGEDDVNINTAISVTFNEEMNAETINTSTFILRQGADFIEGTVEYSGATAAFIPEDDLSYDETYRVTITDNVEDTAGNNLPADTEWQFTTREFLDIIPPEVSSIEPAANADDVPLNTAVSVTFSEEINTSTLSTTTFTLRQGSILIDGSVESFGARATFTPENNLLPGQSYTAIITTGVEDLSGNNLSQNFEWNFSTEELIDDIPPEVVNTDPEAGEDDVDADTDISVTFSEAMNPETINTSTFILQENGPGNSGDEIRGSVEYSGVTATFTPAENLNDDENYLAIISTEVEDTSGNNLEEAFRWGFQTREDDDDEDDD